MGRRFRLYQPGSLRHINAHSLRENQFNLENRKQPLPDLMHHALTAFMAFLAMMNPVANAVIFLGLTAEMGVATTRHVAWRAVRMAFFIVLTFALFGPLVFSLFGITLPALRVAGGVLIALVGFRMLHGENSRVSHPRQIPSESGSEVDSSQNDIAITPLAIPPPLAA